MRNQSGKPERCNHYRHCLRCARRAFDRRVGDIFCVEKAQKQSTYIEALIIPTLQKQALEDKSNNVKPRRVAQAETYKQRRRGGLQQGRIGKEARRPRRVTKYQAQGLEAQVATLSDQVKELTQAINKFNARLDAK